MTLHLIVLVSVYISLIVLASSAVRHFTRTASAAPQLERR